MKKLFTFLVAAASIAAYAQDTYLGIYMQGGKIGWSSYKSGTDTLSGKKVQRSDSKTFMGAGLLGQSMQITIDSTTWTDASGRPLKMLFVMSSAGRTQKVIALFNGAVANVDIDNGGTKSKKTLAIPAGGKVVDDPLSLMVGDKVKPGARQTIYVLDPTTVSFIKNEVVLVGPSKTKVKGKDVGATQIDIIDPRASMKVFMSAKGDLIKAEGPMGMEMIPESKAVAMAGDTGYKPSADLAFSTSLRPDKEIKDPSSLTGLTLRITGKDLSRLPNDEHQSVKKEGEAWVVDVHPPQQRVNKAATISEAAKSKAEWTKPSMHIPSSSKKFVELAAAITKGETDTQKAALLIQAWVEKQMTPNAGIGVLRDANEVLSSKEGVCRDYAILTATLMRAAGIPTRLASGLVNWNGDFFYHAWVEIWNGSTWIGIDSTTKDTQISAAHVKLSDGNVEEAFAFTFLDKVKVEVLDIRR